TRSNRNFQFLFGDFDYKHTFKKDGHKLTGNLHISKSDNGGDGVDNTHYYNSEGKLRDYQHNQLNNSDGDGLRLSGQVDYENPISESMKFEAGLKYSKRSSNSIYNVYNGEAPDTTFNELLSSDYKYDEEIYAAYFQFSQEFEKFNYQLGLRTEQYTYSGAIP